jgi:hypothetical protein
MEGFELTISDQGIHFMLCILVVANREMVDFCPVYWKGECRFFWLALRLAGGLL